MSDFKFELKQSVMIKQSSEIGEIRARSENVSMENQYLIFYEGGDGRATEQWWFEDQLDLYQP